MFKKFVVQAPEGDGNSGGGGAVGFFKDLFVPRAAPAPVSETVDIKEPNPNIPTQGKPEPKGLDAFTPKPPEEKKPDQAIKPGIFGYDDGILVKKLGEQDFSTQISPELLQAFQNDPSKLAPLLGQAIQAAVVNAVKITEMLVSRGTEASMTRFEADRLPQILDNLKLENAALSANPVLNHPAVKTMRPAILRQVREQFPQASEADLAKKVNEMLISFAEEIQNGNKGSTSPRNESSGNELQMDWTKILNS